MEMRNCAPYEPDQPTMHSVKKKDSISLVQSGCVVLLCSLGNGVEDSTVDSRNLEFKPKQVNSR